MWAWLVVPLPRAELLERVFLRVGSAESDEQLQQVLSRFLTPTIAKLTSSHKSVQDKVTSDPSCHGRSPITNAFL